MVELRLGGGLAAGFELGDGLEVGSADGLDLGHYALWGYVLFDGLELVGEAPDCGLFGLESVGQLVNFVDTHLQLL